MSKIHITHPELGEARVVASAVRVWLARGWTAVEHAAESVEKAVTPRHAAEASESHEDASATPENYADAALSDVTAS